MKKTLYLLLSILYLNVSLAQDSDTVNIEILSEIDNVTSYDFFLQPMFLGIAGNFITISSGAILDIDNIADKFSFHGRFVYNFGKYNQNEMNNTLRSYDYLDKKANNLEAIFGYSFGIEEKINEKLVTLEKIGNTNYVSNIDVKEIHSYEVRLGYIQNGVFASGGISQEDFSGNYEIFNKMNNLSIGFASHTSSNSKYNTDKYGIRYNNNKVTYYSDLFFSLPQKFVYIEDITSGYPGEEESAFVPIDQQNIFRSYFSKMPVGFRVGVKRSATPIKQNKIRINTSIELGMNSGYFSQVSSGIFNLVFLNVGIGFGIIQYSN